MNETLRGVEGWTIRFPNPRTNAYNGGAIPASHFVGLSKILNFTNHIISTKLVGNATVGAMVLKEMQSVPIVFTKDLINNNPWSVSGAVTSCSKVPPHAP